MTEATLFTLWGVSLAIIFVVAIVVAILLSRILKTARNIESVAGEIWTVGKLVANNTVHIPLLRETNRVAGNILGTAVQIVGGAEAIEQHANGCPGCPQCVIDMQTQGKS